MTVVGSKVLAFGIGEEQRGGIRWEKGEAGPL